MSRGICWAIGQLAVVGTLIYEAFLLIHAITTLPIRRY